MTWNDKSGMPRGTNDEWQPKSVDVGRWKKRCRFCHHLDEVHDLSGECKAWGCDCLNGETAGDDLGALFMEA